VCLVTGVPWETYWTLTGAEVSALGEAFKRVQPRNKSR